MMKKGICLLMALWLLLGGLALAEENVLDLRGKSFSGLEAVCKAIDEAGEIDTVDLTNVILSLEIRSQLVKKYPDIHFRWTLDVFGVKVTTEDTVLNLANKYVGDRDKLCQYLDCLPNLEQVLMYNNYTTHAERERMYYGYPDIFFGWKFTMENGKYGIRTESTAFSTLKDGEPPYWTNANTSWVQFCPDLKALDLGHNAISDLSFLEKGPKLKVLILACNPISDLTSLASQTELEYLELFSNKITDISPLASLTQLKDLNLCNNQITDLSPLYDLPNIERIWLTNNPGITQEQKDALRAHQPDAEIVYESNGATGALLDENGEIIPNTGWRHHKRFPVVWTIFNKGAYLPWDADLTGLYPGDWQME